MLIDEETRLREKLYSANQAEAELKTQLLKSFDGKQTMRHTPEKDTPFESALNHIDHSSIHGGCSNCDSLKEENKELRQKLSYATKEVELQKLQNEELLKQIRLMSVAEEEDRATKIAKDSTTSKFHSHQSTSLQTGKILGENKFPSFSQPTEIFQQQERLNGGRQGHFSPPTTASAIKEPPFTGSYKQTTHDLAETLRNLKETQSKLEGFQFKVNQDLADHSGRYDKMPHKLGKQYQIDEQVVNQTEKIAKEPNTSSDLYTQFMAKYGLKTDQTLLPKKRDFSVPREESVSHKIESLISNTGQSWMSSANLTGKSHEHNKYLSKTEEGFYKEKGNSGVGKLGDVNIRGSTYQPAKDSMLKELETLENILKQDSVNLRSRREDRPVLGLEERIRGDHSMDLTKRTYSRFEGQPEDKYIDILGRKQRKSIGHAPQSKYLERLSKLYDGQEDHPSAVLGGDQSFSSQKRASSSMDRTLLTNTDSFLKQINDRINNLVTK